MGVIYGSATTQNSTFCSILCTRGAAVAEQAMPLEPCDQNILMGYGSPVSNARFTASQSAMPMNCTHPGCTRSTVSFFANVSGSQYSWAVA